MDLQADIPTVENINKDESVNNEIKLIALDIDGTLTNDRKEITPKTFEALMAAQKRGIRLILASARPAPGLFAICDQLHMREYDGILMSYNGGRIVDAPTNTTLYQQGIEVETMRSILRYLEQLPVTPILDDGDLFYVTDLNGYKVAYECRNNQMTCVEVPNLADFIHFSTSKLLIAVNPDAIYAVQDKIAAFLPSDLTVVRTAVFYLEIIPRSINKGKGLLDICHVLEIDPQDTVAFGDAENDISMIKAAGIGVAMANGEEPVRKAADFVTAGNNEDGIAEALIRIIPNL